MKKKLLIIIVYLLINQSAKTQTCQGPPILSEDFNAGIPVSWTILNYDTCTLLFNMPERGYTGTWQSYEHYGRQCVTDADHYITNCFSNDYLITPPITVGNSPTCLSWLGSTMYTAYTENYEVLISTTTPDSTGLKAHPPLAIINNDSPTWGAHSIDLSAYAGQTIYIAFWNHTNDQYAIYIDDIRVSTQVNLDASVTSANFPDVMAPSSIVVSGQLVNGGLTSITSFNLNWQLGNGSVNSMPVSSVNIAPSSFYNYTHNINWTPTSNGTYTMKIWASNLNGTNDMYHANDTLTKTLFINTTPRKSLIETFSQASCPPCAPFNSSSDPIIQPNISSGVISSVKYHTIWPGVDPMNVYDKPDVAQRVLYYGIGSVPSLLIDGTVLLGNCGAYTGSAVCLAQEDIDSAITIPSIFNINIEEAKTPSVFNATVTLTAKTDLPFSSFSLYAVVMEDTVVYSTEPGTNGETTFYQVARKMLPDSTGQPLSAMTNNQTIIYTYTYNPNTSICNLSKLHLVAFVSDDATRHVYQSENGGYNVLNGIKKYTVNDLKIYPNPTNTNFTIETNTSAKQVVSLYDINGKLILTRTITGKTSIDASNLNDGVYNISISNNEGITNKRLVIVH